MFIRSQNRDVLVNVNDICLNKLNIHSEIIYQFRCYGYGDDYYILCEYSTEEKAMKVLDMIQNAITGTRFKFTDIVRDCDLAGIESHNVFNMPKDDEVEA